MSKIKDTDDLYNHLSRNYALTPSTIKYIHQWIDDQNKLRDRLIKKVDLILDHLHLRIKDVPAKTIIEDKDIKAKG